MNEIELLKEYLDTEMNNIFAMSADYRMTRPRRGLEIPFAEAKERAELLRGLIRRLGGEE